MELLERRVMLDAGFSALAAMIDDRLLELQNDISIAVQTATALPVLGSKIDAIAATAQAQLADFRTHFKKELGKLNSSDTEETLENKLRSGLQNLGLLPDPPNDLGMAVAARDRRDPGEHVEVSPSGFVEEPLHMPLDQHQWIAVEREERRMAVPLPERQHLFAGRTAIAPRPVAARWHPRQRGGAGKRRSAEAQPASEGSYIWLA